MKGQRTGIPKEPSIAADSSVEPRGTRIENVGHPWPRRIHLARLRPPLGPILLFGKCKIYCGTMIQNEQDLRIASRLKVLREAKGWGQEEFAAALGVDHRQTVTAIEAGTRRIRPRELVRAAAVLEVDLETLTDPYRLVGEGSFNFRAKDVEPEAIAAFEENASRWIATYRELSTRLGVEPGPLGSKLELTRASSFEDAMAAGEALWAKWKLGAVPASELESAIERELGTLVLYVDAHPGISGAASRLPKYNTILVNRRDSSGRRYFDLAHELFHILTWDAMPPDRVEDWEVTKKKGNRVEYLADNFAGALLMPARVLRPMWDAMDGEDLGEWVAQTAAQLHVSGDALKWRLVNVGLLSLADAKRLVVRAATSHSASSEPLLFNRRFVERISTAVNSGMLSLRRAASLLGLHLDELTKLCTAYGHPLAYDLPE